MNTDTLSITVVIPAFNSGNYLRETLTSILAQSRRAKEILVVDDGSTDDTRQVALEFGARVSCISTENGGQGRARRIAIEQANTEWIALCDSDDLWEPNHIERRHQLLEAYPDVEVTFSDFYSFGPNATANHNLLNEAPDGWIGKWCDVDELGFYSLRHPYQAILAFNPIYLSGMMFRKDSYERMGGFLERYSRWIGEDSEFTRRFAALENCTFVGDTHATWGYRRHNSNYSAVQWKNIKAKADILDEHLRLGVVPPSCVAATRTERDYTRASAFDQACWEKASGDAASLFSALPPVQRTVKRRVKALLARAGLFF